MTEGWHGGYLNQETVLDKIKNKVRKQDIDITGFTFTDGVKTYLSRKKLESRREEAIDIANAILKSLGE